MATIHVIDKSGSVAKGIPALTLLYEQTVRTGPMFSIHPSWAAALTALLSAPRVPQGLGWVFKLAKIPLFGEAANIIYKLVRPLPSPDSHPSLRPSAPPPPKNTAPSPHPLSLPHLPSPPPGEQEPPRPRRRPRRHHRRRAYLR